MQWLLHACQARPKRRIDLREWGRALGMALRELAGLAGLSLFLVTWLMALTLIRPGV